ncbi:MAG: ACGX-repeat peptide [Lachnospiraceae bacterium]|nr:ACGX-repeat peptide [Lachnospiraceae bacterium]
MALSNLFGWKDETSAASCGTACGASDKLEEKPAACGSSCGAGDK